METLRHFGFGEKKELKARKTKNGFEVLNSDDFEFDDRYKAVSHLIYDGFSKTIKEFKQKASEKYNIPISDIKVVE